MSRFVANFADEFGILCVGTCGSCSLTSSVHISPGLPRCPRRPRQQFDSKQFKVPNQGACSIFFSVLRPFARCIARRIVPRGTGITGKLTVVIRMKVEHALINSKQKRRHQASRSCSFLSTPNELESKHAFSGEMSVQCGLNLMKNFDHSQSSDAFRVPLTNTTKPWMQKKNLKDQESGQRPS